MQQTVQRIIIFSLLILIAALSLKTCFRKQKENAILKDIVEIRQDSTQFWKDKFNTEHAEKRIIEGNLATLQVVYHDLIDSVQNRLNIKNSNDLQSTLTAGTAASGVIHPTVDTVLNSDSTKEFRFRFNDRWLDLSGIIGDRPVISYRFSDSVVFTTYSKRVSMFKKETYIDGYSLNPNVKISGIVGIRISNDRQSRWGIGPYIGVGWTGVTWSPSAGISLHYSLIKF